MMKLLLFLFMLNLVIKLMDLKFLMFMMVNLIFILSFMFMMIMNYGSDWSSVSGWMGLDYINFILILLTLWIIGLMYMVSINFKNLKFYSFILLMLLFSLIMSFVSMNYFMFYLFFEISLIPTFLIIMGWGYQPERINASMYMLLYTMFASLPMLIIIFYMYNYFNSLSYFILMNEVFFLSFNSFIIYFYMIFAFLVKLPMFMFHLWLPKAHIEAPVTGSMILAAVMLKLGGYGLMRSFLFMLNLVVKYNFLIFGFCLFGMIYLSLLSLRCNDFKLIVAYSSVVHMGMMMMGLLSMTFIGYMGGLIMMVGHGLCSSALFLLINYSYEWVKSRNLLLNKGMVFFLPTLSMWWFMFCVINMSAPISLNLLSEIFVLMVLFNWSMKIFLLLMLGMYFSAMYSLYLFSYSQHGMFSMNISKIKLNNVITYLVLFIHWIPLNFLILKMDIFI